MKTLLLLVVCLGCLMPSAAQDSLYYSIFWTPKELYRKAGIRQEGIVLYQYKKGVLHDSTLLQTKVYDSLGQLIRLENFRFNRLLNRFTYCYSGARLDSLVQEERWLRATVTHRFAYDERGNQLLQQSFNGRTKTVQSRYVYNQLNQPVEFYSQIGEGKEELATVYSYRPDHLLQRTDYTAEGRGKNESYLHLYAYTNAPRTVTRFFQKRSDDKRFIDYRKTYNEAGQLTEVLYPPLREKNWRPADLHARPDETVELLFYLPNGLLHERHFKINDRLVQVERHYYL